MNDIEISDDQIGLLDLVAFLWKKRKIIIGSTLATFGLIFLFLAISLILPPEKSPLPNLYTSTSTVRINEVSNDGGLSSMLASSGAGAIAGLMGVGGVGSSKSGMVIDLAKSNTIIDQIVNDFNLKTVFDLNDSKYPITDSRKEVKERLSISLNEDSGNMLISYEDINKEMATDIVNKIVDVLEKRFAELDKTSNYSQTILLEGKITDIEQDIASIQQQILNFQNSYGILDARSFAEIVGEKQVTLRTALMDTEAAITTYEKNRNIQDSNLIILKEQKAALENSLIALDIGSVDGIPALSKLPVIVMEFEELTRNLEVQFSIYKTLRQQYEILKLQSGGTGPIFQIIEYAEVPERKSGPSRVKLCVIGTLAAFIMSIILAFLKEALINIKNDPESMKKIKGQV